MERVRLVTEWAGRPAGVVLEVDALRAARLLELGIAEPALELEVAPELEAGGVAPRRKGRG